MSRLKHAISRLQSTRDDLIHQSASPEGSNQRKAVKDQNRRRSLGGSNMNRRHPTVSVLS